MRILTTIFWGRYFKLDFFFKYTLPFEPPRSSVLDILFSIQTFVNIELDIKYRELYFRHTGDRAVSSTTIELLLVTIEIVMEQNNNTALNVFLVFCSRDTQHIRLNLYKAGGGDVNQVLTRGFYG